MTLQKIKKFERDGLAEKSYLGNFSNKDLDFEELSIWIHVGKNRVLSIDHFEDCGPLKVTFHNWTGESFTMPAKTPVYCLLD